MKKKPVGLIKVIMTVTTSLYLMSSVLAFAAPVRVYCRPEGVIFERSGDGTPFTEENKLYDVLSFIIEDGEIPSGQYAEQYRCADGSRVVVDITVITPRIMREEALRNARNQYDEELASSAPDTVRLLRLQRDIERIRAGEQEVVEAYQPTR